MTRLRSLHCKVYYRYKRPPVVWRSKISAYDPRIECPPTVQCSDDHDDGMLRHPMHGSHECFLIIREGTNDHNMEESLLIPLVEPRRMLDALPELVWCRLETYCDQDRVFLVVKLQHVN